jgi:hypothetical protein
MIGPEELLDAISVVEDSTGSNTSKRSCFGLNCQVHAHFFGSIEELSIDQTFKVK